MFKLEIDTDNAAFADGNLEAEIARLLREAAAHVEQGREIIYLRDINGNHVGGFELDTSKDTGED